MRDQITDRGAEAVIESPPKATTGAVVAPVAVRETPSGKEKGNDNSASVAKASPANQDRAGDPIARLESDRKEFVGDAESQRLDNGCVVYDRSNIAALDRQSISNLNPAQIAYIQGLVSLGVSKYVTNVPTEVEQFLICHNGYALPFTVSSREQKVFCVSPKTCWFDYPRLLYRKSVGRRPAPVSNFLLLLTRMVVRFEKTVTVNNWWLTSNRTPDLPEDSLRAITEYLAAKYPKHILIMKSVRETDPTQIIGGLRRIGYGLIKFRWMFFRTPDAKKTKNFKADRNLLKNTPLKTGYLTYMNNATAEQCERLFRKLYLQKHTDMNTAFNAAWMRLAANTRFLDFFTAELDEKVKSFVVSFHDANGINVGVCGYDQEAPKSMGLYRMLVASALLRGEADLKDVNLSTAVPDYKKRRCNKMVIEYEGVYTEHLPVVTRLLMRFFIWCYNSKPMDNMRCI